MVGANQACIFCQIVRDPSTTHLLHTDEKVVAFQDIKPAAQRHYLVIPKEHIPTTRDLQRRDEDYSLVSHMLTVGKELLQKDAPQTLHRFGFHQPPFNSVDHLHLHCFALPFVPRWKAIKYKSLGPFGGFIEAETLLAKLRPLHSKLSWRRCVLGTAEQLDRSTAYSWFRQRLWLRLCLRHYLFSEIKYKLKDLLWW